MAWPAPHVHAQSMHMATLHRYSAKGRSCVLTFSARLWPLDPGRYMADKGIAVTIVCQGLAELL